MESYLVTEVCAACTRGDLDNVKRLIELGASPWIRDDQGNSLFHLCCSSVQCGLEVLEYLISVSDIVDCSALVNNEGSTLLHLACITGKLEFVRFLFVQYKDAFESCRDIYGHTSLYYACANKHLDIVLFVCSQGTVLSPDNIYDCVKVSTWEITRLLLKKISFRNFMDRVIKEDCVVLANLVIKENVVQWLDVTSLFPLHHSVSLGDMKIVKYLVSSIKYNIESLDNSGNRPLHIACRFSGNLELVKYLVEEAGCDINAKGSKDYTALHWACEKNQLEIVKFLISKPECNRESANKFGNLPLHLACCFSGNVELVRFLVEEAGCDINAKGNNDNTSLHWACDKNQLEIVKFLTSKPECNRESATKLKNLPLHLACGFSGNVELVRYLVEEVGCDINAKGNNDYTSLHWACEKNQLEIVKFLTSKPDCNLEAGDKNSNRPLTIACLFSNNVELVRYLVEEAGCDINGKGKNDYTSLHEACEKNLLEIVKFLTSKPKCNQEAQSYKGYRPLHLACGFSGNVELVRYLVEEAGCDINAKDNNDSTSLHWACERNQLEIVKFLTSKSKCNRESPNKFGNLPLHLACCFSGNVKLVRFLVEEAGCDINAKGNNDYTSLHWACDKNQLEIVKFLTSKPECNRESATKLKNLPLHLACGFSGNLELVRYLVEQAGCNINAKGNNDYTSLHWACEKNQLEIVKFLTSKPECNREAGDKNSNRPLHIACLYSGNVELVRYLVEEAGCDINAKGSNDYTSLHEACENNLLEIVKFLTSKPKCNQEAQSYKGYRPLHLACGFSGNVELVRYLVEEAGCNINAKDNNDYTSLHWACDRNQLEIVKFLTSKPECNCEAGDKNSNRPLHIACMFSGNVELVRYLVEEAGCDINAKDMFNDSPLLIACNSNNKILVEYFITHPECQTVVSLTDVKYDDGLQRLLKHHIKFQQALKSSGVISLRAVKCILTGPPGSGKSTLKNRLLNDPVLKPCSSTGVVDSAIQVKSFRKLHELSAIVSGLEDSFCKWKKHDLDEEAAYLFERVLSSSLTKPVSSDINNPLLNVKHINEKDQLVDSSEKSHDNVYNSLTFNSENMETQKDIVTYIHNDSDSGDGNCMTSDLIVSPLESSNIKAIQTLSETLQSTYVNNKAKLEDTSTSEQVSESSHALLHIIDTGGQPEFHEILPALITGPAINLLTFKLTDDIRSCFKITYRSSSGDLDPYESSFSLEDAIFRSLASIACLRQNTIGWTFDELPIKDDSEPAAFLIATHRDCVDESKVCEVNEQIKLKIQNSVELFHENLVQFSSKEQAIFALDTIRDQKNIEHLRTALHNVILSNFKELHIPVSWCSFNVLLQKSDESIFKLDNCIKLAQKCGISVREEFMSALWFLHYRVGSIMYYPEVKGLEDIIITNLQCVFDHITHLITSSFTFRGIQKPGSKELFRTSGQFSESALRTLFSRSNSPLTPQKFISLLKHLHIIAGPMKGLKSENYYFLPCALKPTTLEQELGDVSMFPAPLLIYFECGYCPVGVFCCLVVHLVSTTQKSELKWELSNPPHCRNKITFTVGKCYDKITLISRATFLEISINRIPEITEALPLSEVCLGVYKMLNKSIKIVTESLHYTNKTRYFFGFPCTVCQCSSPHPAICEYDNPVAGKCVYGRAVLPLEKKHTIWFDKVEFFCESIMFSFVCRFVLYQIRHKLV